MYVYLNVCVGERLRDSLARNREGEGGDCSMSVGVRRCYLSSESVIRYCIYCFFMLF